MQKVKGAQCREKDMDEIVIENAQQDVRGWLKKIEAQHPKSIDLGLERVSCVAERLDCISFDCPVITVAGTNGKGSCSHTIQSICQAAKLKTGLYTSPHINHFNERIVIAGQPVSDAALCEAFHRVEVARGRVTLTYFEFTTLAALVLFKQAYLECLILEVGLGGRLDAVNCVDPDVSIITSIAHDHASYLGDTLDAIAAEKAGIMRNGKPAIVASYAAYRFLKPHVDQREASCVARGHQYDYGERENGTWYWYMPGKGSVQQLRKPTFPIENAAAAIAALHQLELDLPQIDKRAIQEGLKQVSVPGRCQVISETPLMIVDAAHNPAAATWLAKQLWQYPKITRWRAVFGCMQDKDIAGIVQPMQPLVHAWHLTELSDPRAATLAELGKYFERKNLSYQTHSNVTDALQTIQKAAVPQEGIIIFGSFLTIAPLLK